MKRLLFVCTIIAALFYAPVTGASLNDIQNLPDSLKTPVTLLLAEGAIEGYSDGSFRPQEDITAGEFGKILVIPILQNVLSDVTSNSEAELLRAHIKEGDIWTLLLDAERYEIFDIDDLDAEQDEPITRAEAVELIIEAYKLSYLNVNIENMPFVDVKNKEFAKKVMFLYNDSIVKGRDETHFKPDSRLTRAEAAKLLYLTKETYLQTLVYDDYGFNIGGVRIEISDVSPSSLTPGESATILFSVREADSGKVIQDIDLADVTVNVVEGDAQVGEVREVGGGVFMARIDVPKNAGIGHVNVQIAVLYGRLYVTETDEFFDQKTVNTSGDIKVFPSTVRRNNTATIIAIPRDHHDDPVSGLSLRAFVNGGGGKIIDQMEEEPAGSGIYTATYEAGSVADTVEVGVTITDYVGDNTYYVTFEVK